MTSFATLSCDSDFARSHSDVQAFGCGVGLTPRAALTDLSAEWQALPQRWSGATKAALAEVPEIAAYRRFYTDIGLDATRTPPSTQNLVQRFLIGDAIRPLPALPYIVNVINVVAVRTLIPLGAFDSAAITDRVRIACAGRNDTMAPIGCDGPMPIPEGASILRDDEKVPSQFCYRDGEAKKTRHETRHLMLLGCQVPGIGVDHVLGSLTATLAELAGSSVVSQDPTL